LIVALGASAPVLVQLLSSHAGGLLAVSVEEYLAFIVLLASLFIISGAIQLQGSLAGTPWVNTAFLASGSILASLIGTTGASMLLIRPLLRANETRDRKSHLVIFFIFIVSNAGGLLTPLGDPPLFLGFLRGVPFLWTLGLFAPWALVNGVLLVLAHLLDRVLWRKEEQRRPGSPDGGATRSREPLRIRGGLNFLWLLGVLAINVGVGTFGRSHHWSDELQKALLIAGMGAFAGLSLVTTPGEIRTSNRFSWRPLIEVAVLFLGIFVTMVPAMVLLEHLGRSGAIRMTLAWQFFWGSGLVSTFLDNAPTYVSFASLAAGVLGGPALPSGGPADLGSLLAHPQGILLLKAVSSGSVFMGANSYLGNGPNLLVKAVAEENGVRMPSFLGYMGWSVAILVPLFLVVTLVFFR
ncbi:MAG TPA: sodium:proton antiporter, partial [Planctomycetota bacterium]|nr:sodium:proton antiporter [Planctomycetota bacterium]